MAQTSMNSVKEIATRVDNKFREEFGRGYGIIEPVMVEDAEIVIVTAGSITSTARVGIKTLREKGHRIGLLKIRLFRPFPIEAVQAALRGKKRVAVIDRNISLGGGGIFCQELRAAMVHSPDHPFIFSYIAGIGGTDVDPEVIQKIALDVVNKTEPIDEPIWIME
jgi:pyruvate/2-oxoacid:ferredoxin oxidoreductase alpha subunit